MRQKFYVVKLTVNVDSQGLHGRHGHSVCALRSAEIALQDLKCVGNMHHVSPLCK